MTDSQIRKFWQLIKGRLEWHGMTISKLAEKTRYARDLILRGIQGEIVEIDYEEFAQKCVIAFNITSGRTMDYEDTGDISLGVCMKMLELPEEPPQQTSLFD